MGFEATGVDHFTRESKSAVGDRLPPPVRSQELSSDVVSLRRMIRSGPHLPAVAVAALLVVAGCAGPVGSPGGTDATPSPTVSTSPVPGTQAPTTEPNATTTASTTTTPPPVKTPPPTSATGTTAPTPTPTPADPDAGSETVRVEGGPIPVNASLVFHRVEEILDANARPPVVRIDPPGFHASEQSVDSFDNRMGLVRNRSELTIQFRGSGTADAVILLLSNTTLENVSARELELALVHEFVHVHQHQRAEGDGFPVAPDRRRTVASSLAEGGAVYVTEVYASRYGVPHADGRLPIEHRAHEYRTRADWRVEWSGRYYFGGRYLDRRLDDPSDLWAAYADPPATMEQIIHGPGVEPARPLAVAVEAPGWEVRRRGPRGELSLRAILRSELERAAAAAAATGWGNDSLVRLDAGNDTGFAWALRWDDAGEADEFEGTLRRFVEERREAGGGALTVARVAPETVVLLVGPRSFVRATTADGTNATVTVAVESPA